MENPERDQYIVKVVFRGLCLGRLHDPPDARIEVLLPEASEPSRMLQAADDPVRSLLQGLQHLREHHAILEFPVADWDNRSALTPGLIVVEKPTKEPVGMFFIRGRRLRFQGLWETPGATALLPPPLIPDGPYVRPSEQLAVLLEHAEHGFDQLHGFASTPAPNALEHSAAVAELAIGEVYSERRSLSRSGRRQRLWESLGLNELGSDPDRDRARPLNLDLVVRFALPIVNPLLIVCEQISLPATSIAGFQDAANVEPRHFILRPRPGRREITIWVKNRELSAVLNDSDLDPDPFAVACDDPDDVDRDHGYYIQLAETPETVRVPRDFDREASDCAGGCGVCGYPPPRP